MDWDVLGIALLLVLAGLYFLESEKTQAVVDNRPVAAPRPARNALERAWMAEPVQVFMRQLLAARQRRARQWQVGTRY